MKAYGHSYPVTFAMMFLVSLLSSYMMTKIQRQSQENAKRAHRTEILLTNSRKLRRAYTMETVSNEMAAQIQKLMNLTVIVYLKKADHIQQPKIYLRKGIAKAQRDELILDYTAKTPGCLETDTGRAARPIRFRTPRPFTSLLWETKT